MNFSTINSKLAAVVSAVLVCLLSPALRAHCDGVDGPVVKAAQRALAEGNVDLVLSWVQRADEAEIREAFEQTRAVRKLNARAKALADRFFFETLVRIHRAGEGAPYTGLKSAGRDLGPAIPAADRALETGDIESVGQLLTTDLKEGLREHFEDAVARKKLSHQSVEAGREFVKAYVGYIHYVEGLHQATTRTAHGHFPESEAHAAAHDDAHATAK